MNKEDYAVVLLIEQTHRLLSALDTQNLLGPFLRSKSSPDIIIEVTYPVMESIYRSVVTNKYAPDAIRTYQAKKDEPPVLVLHDGRVVVRAPSRRKEYRFD